MDAFPSKRKRKLHQQRFDRSRNPTKGRTAAESNRIMRACKRFVQNIAVVNSITGDSAVMPWLPADDVITDRDDDAIVDWRGVAENLKQNGYERDEDGLLVQMQDEGIRASNRIQAVTTYADWYGDVCQEYMVRKALFSPFYCPEWGALPLTMTQWRIIALALIDTRVRWQWEEAVNVYAERNGIPIHDRFRFLSCVGWNLAAPAKTPSQGAVEQWTGHIIYTLAATASLNPITHSNGGLE